MNRCVRVAIIGDARPGIPGYPAICEALQHAADVLAVPVATHWLPTHALHGDVERQLSHYHALWCGPWGPYTNANGALRAIKYARESSMPFLGTCAGFQQAVIEFAHSIVGLKNADHAEANPDSNFCVINALSEPMVERTGAVALDPNSRAARIYRRTISAEKYRCAFGLNPAYMQELHQAGFRVTGVSDKGAAAVMEFADHPFFLATLFLPECISRACAPHPLITAYLRTAAELNGIRA
ncbi:MAG: hypothetical protein ABI120_19205 [Gemmatimonadaceae bacterium]